MKDSKILEKFFEKQHRQWKKEAYAVLQSTRKELGVSATRLSPKNKVIESQPALGSQNKTKPQII